MGDLTNTLDSLPTFVDMLDTDYVTDATVWEEEAKKIARAYATGRLDWPKMPAPTRTSPGMCARCADRGHTRYVHSSDWKRCHSDGWKQAILERLDPSAAKRFRSYSSKRSPNDRWSLGCSACNADDQDHVSERRCGNDCCTVVDFLALKTLT